MKGLTESGLKAIEKLVRQKFDLIALKFIGLIPKASQEKNIVFRTTSNNLITLYLRSLRNRDPKLQEERALKSLLSVANNYLNSYRDLTVARVLNNVNSYVSDQRSKDLPISPKKVSEIVSKDMGKAKNSIKMMANAESQKAINLGNAMQISKLAEERGERDPTVFFVVIDDSRTGFYEYILHLLPDRKTPRVWKLSEIQSGYYTPGDQYPSLSGLHISCRCRLTFLSRGFGFNKDGHVTYIAKGHDEFKVQREKYGLPNVPEKPKKKNGKWVFND